MISYSIGELVSYANDYEKKNKIKFKKDLEYYYKHDTSYHGFVNIRIMRILGWLLLLLAAFCGGLSLFLNYRHISSLDKLTSFLSSVSSLSVSALMIASFSYILQNRANFKRVLIVYFLGALFLFIGFCVLYFVYVALTINKVTGFGYIESVSLMNKFIAKLFGTSLSFNIFIDLFMFTFFCYFLFCTPTKYFQGSKLYIFRALSLIPLVYLLIAFLWKTFAAFEIWYLPAYVYPLLPTKSPAMFIAFASVAISVKAREHSFKKKGYTLDQYMAVYKSNGNSWIVARSFAIFLIVYGCIDYLLLNLVVLIYDSQVVLINNIISQMTLLCDSDGNVLPQYVEQYNELSIQYDSMYVDLGHINSFIKDSGLGNSCLQVFFAPIVLLFSFNKSYKADKLDLLVPLIGVVGIIFVYFNWGFILFLTT